VLFGSEAARAYEVRGVLSKSRLLRDSSDRVAYFEVRDRDYVVHCDYTKSVPHLRGRYSVASFGPQLLSMYHAGKAAVQEYVKAEMNLSPEEQAAFEAIQIQSFVGVPLVKKASSSLASPFIWLHHGSGGRRKLRWVHHFDHVTSLHLQSRVTCDNQAAVFGRRLQVYKQGCRGAARIPVVLSQCESDR
jgi:hypothetical protein